MVSPISRAACKGRLRFDLLWRSGETARACGTEATTSATDSTAATRAVYRDARLPALVDTPMVHGADAWRRIILGGDFGCWRRGRGGARQVALPREGSPSASELR